MPNQHAFFQDTSLLDPEIPYSQKQPRLLQAAQEYLSYFRDSIRQRHRQGTASREVVGYLTSAADTLIRNLYRCVAADLSPDQQATAVIALGGYGRGELNPYSDLDLLFYTGQQGEEQVRELSERLLYLLWDLRLPIGHSVRTGQACWEEAAADTTVRTSLLDARFLVGQQPLWQDFQQGISSFVLEHRTKEFIHAKEEENSARRQKYGASVYLLEPNLKEGEGGLRDLHTAFWIARVKFKAQTVRELVHKGVLSERELRQLQRCFDYLWRIRNELHYLNARKNDQLHFADQEALAAFLGYTDQDGGPLAVERFMQDYYTQATRTEHLASVLTAKAIRERELCPSLNSFSCRRELEQGFYMLRGELRLSRKNLMTQDPALIMQAFALAHRHQLQLSLALKSLIRSHLHLIDDQLRRSPRMTQPFWEILQNQQHLTETLQSMHHLQFLQHFIPEFARIYCQVQHDAYHIYTVDIHSIFAVGELCRLWQGDYAEDYPLLSQVAAQVENREILLLAALLHDIGKGQGHQHAEKGARMIPPIARRLGMSRESSRLVAFLVREHLLMAHTSQRRDLNDPQTIRRFVSQVTSCERLQLLYLLTFADIRAIGPDVWTQWKGYLLDQLYERAYEALERGNFAGEARSGQLRQRKRALLDRLRGELPQQQLQEWLDMLPRRYLLSWDSHSMARHMRLLWQGDPQQEPLVAAETHGQAGFAQVLVATPDIPGLFAVITGILAAHGRNILGAQIYTLNNGLALDLLQVALLPGEDSHDAARWEAVAADLRACLAGQRDVNSLVAQRQRSEALLRRQLPCRPPRFELDNDSSSDYTIIDIRAPDRVGLLFDIARRLYQLGLYMGVAKISTQAQEAVDTFYVQDIFGQKLNQSSKIAQLEQELAACLQLPEEGARA